MRVSGKRGIPTYVQGSSLDDMYVVWRDTFGRFYPFGDEVHVFSLQMALHESENGLVLDKTQNIIGQNADEETGVNVIVRWDDGELDDLPAALYVYDLIAIRSSDSKERKTQGKLRILPKAGAGA